MFIVFTFLQPPRGDFAFCCDTSHITGGERGRPRARGCRLSPEGPPSQCRHPNRQRTPARARQHGQPRRLPLPWLFLPSSPSLLQKQPSLEHFVRDSPRQKPGTSAMPQAHLNSDTNSSNHQIPIIISLKLRVHISPFLPQLWQMNEKTATSLYVQQEHF